MSPPPLYIILDTQFLSISMESLLATFGRAGTGWVQLREKQAGSKVFFDTARTFVSLCHRYGLTSIINDRVDIALLADADGIHLGQDDLPVEEARKLLPPGKILGISTHNLNQALEAQKSSADYVAIGPVFPTRSKEKPDPVVSREELKTVRSQISKPLVAIGGVTSGNAAELYTLGLNSVAVIRDILTATDIETRIRQYLAIAQQALRAVE